MILRPVRPASPSGPPMTNLPVGLMYQLQSSAILQVAQRLADIGFDDLADLLGIPALVEMLGRQHDLGHLGGLAVDVAHGDLALGVGAELADVALAGMAGGGQQFEDLVAVVDRRRHQVRRLAAGIAEHDALVAGTLLALPVGGIVDALARCRPTGRAAEPRSWRSSSGSRPARSRCRGSPCGRPT